MNYTQKDLVPGDPTLVHAGARRFCLVEGQRPRVHATATDGTAFVVGDDDAQLFSCALDFGDECDDGGECALPRRFIVWRATSGVPMPADVAPDVKPLTDDADALYARIRLWRADSSHPTINEFRRAYASKFGVVCNCGHPALKQTVAKKESVNVGQEFWVCCLGMADGKCSFYRWCNKRAEWANAAFTAPTDALRRQAIKRLRDE